MNLLKDTNIHPENKKNKPYLFRLSAFFVSPSECGLIADSSKKKRPEPCFLTKQKKEYCIWNS